MARQKQRSQLSAIGDINMTPLIDLTFLLLISFMITVPLMEFAVNVNPPEMNAEPLPEEESQIINLDRDGKIKINKKYVDMAELKEELQYLVAKDKKANILIRADGERQYKEVMEIMKIVKGAGFTNVSLVTQAEE